MNVTPSLRRTMRRLAVGAAALGVLAVPAATVVHDGAAPASSRWSVVEASSRWSTTDAGVNVPGSSRWSVVEASSRWSVTPLTVADDVSV